MIRPLAARMQGSGFDRADIDLMAGVEAVRQKLGDVFAPVEELADISIVPRRAFIAREDVGLARSIAVGLLIYIGATAGVLGQQRVSVAAAFEEMLPSLPRENHIVVEIWTPFRLRNLERGMHDVAAHYRSPAKMLPFGRQSVLTGAALSRA